MNAIKKYEYFTLDELKYRGYSFTFMLYEDSETYNFKSVIDRVIWLSSIENAVVKEYAYIKHDKDEGKEHYHLAVKFTKQKSVKSVLDILYLERYNPNERDVIVGSWKGILNYLIHNTKDSIKDGKYKYPEDDVISNIPHKILHLRQNKDLSEIFLDITDWIENQHTTLLYLTDVIRYCREKEDRYMMCLTDRKYNFMIMQILRERNMKLK